RAASWSSSELADLVRELLAALLGRGDARAAAARRELVVVGLGLFEERQSRRRLLLAPGQLVVELREAVLDRRTVLARGAQQVVGAVERAPRLTQVAGRERGLGGGEERRRIAGLALDPRPAAAGGLLGARAGGVEDRARVGRGLAGRLEHAHGVGRRLVAGGDLGARHRPVDAAAPDPPPPGRPHPAA